MSEKRFPRDLRINRKDGQPTYHTSIIGTDAYGLPHKDEAEMTAEELVCVVMCGLLKPEGVPMDDNLRMYLVERMTEIDNEKAVIEGILKAHAKA
jgi:hypothetical protein